jgi:hypothetical protein
MSKSAVAPHANNAGPSSVKERVEARLSAVWLELLRSAVERALARAWPVAVQDLEQEVATAPRHQGPAPGSIGRASGGCGCGFVAVPQRGPAALWTAQPTFINGSCRYDTRRYLPSLKLRNNTAMTNCTSLLRSWGDRFRIFHETEGRPARAKDDEWALIIPGRRGFVAVWGQDRLVACTNATATTKRLLASVPGSVIVQSGDDGANITFPPEHLDTVAVILRLRRKRRYTPAQRQAAAARLARVRPKPLSGSTFSTQIPPISPPAGENPSQGE